MSVTFIASDARVRDRLAAEFDLRPVPGTDGSGIEYAKNAGIFVAYVSDLSDPRSVLDAVEERTAAETLVYAGLGESLLGERIPGDVVFPNAFVSEPGADGGVRPPLFLDLYDETGDVLYEDRFGLSIGGIALDATIPEDADPERVATLRTAYESDVVLPGVYGLLAVHRLEKRPSAFMCVAGIHRVRDVKTEGSDAAENMVVAARAILGSLGD